MAIGWTVANPRSYCGGDLCAPGAKKTAVVLYNWYFKESITSVLQQKKIMPCIKNFARSLLRHGGHGQLYMRWSSSIFAKPLL